MKNTQQQSVHLQNFGETGFNTVFFFFFLHLSEVEVVVVGESLTEAKEFQQQM